jgi:hypothetical protein
MRNTLQEHMTGVIKPLRHEAALTKLKNSVAMHGAMQAVLENKSPVIIDREMPSNKTSFNVKVHTETVKPIVKIKADLGIKFTPLTKIDFNSGVRKEAVKPIMKIKADLGIKISDHEAPKAKSAFNTMSGVVSQKSATNPKFGKRTLH